MRVQNLDDLTEKKCNSYQWWNNDKCRCECKTTHVCKKYYIQNPTSCSCKNGKYLASIMDDSLIMYDEIIDAESKSYDKETNFNENSSLQKRKFLYFTCLFINYCSIIDRCQYLLLSGKISSKTKTLVTTSKRK